MRIQSKVFEPIIKQINTVEQFALKCYLSLTVNDVYFDPNARDRYTCRPTCCDQAVREVS